MPVNKSKVISVLGLRIRDLLNSLTTWVGTSLRIVLRPSPVGRFALLWTYWRISLKENLLVGVFRRHISKERILSQTICLGDYSAMPILFQEVFLSGVYFFASSSPAPKIIDGGANIGVSIAYFKAIYPQCRIVAFEANDRTFALLAKTAERNGWKDVELHHLGLHRTEGELCFYDLNDVAGSLSSGFWQNVSADEAKRVSRVHTVPLSRYVDGRVDLLKLDVEGSEHAILEELEESGKLGLIDRIILEYHHHVQPCEDILGRFLSLLERGGFGYHLRAPLALPFGRAEVQNFMMYALQKGAVGNAAGAARDPCSIAFCRITAQYIVVS